MVQKIKNQWRKPKVRLIVILLFIGLGLVGWMNLEASTPPKTPQDIREFVLEIRNMTFGENNPTLYLKPGETVRFVILNFDQGMKHNFLIQGTEVATRILDYQEKENILFTAPQKEGEMIYECSLHALMMRGRLIVSHHKIAEHKF